MVMQPDLLLLRVINPNSLSAIRASTHLLHIHILYQRCVSVQAEKRCTFDTKISNGLNLPFLSQEELSAPNLKSKCHKGGNTYWLHIHIDIILLLHLSVTRQHCTITCQSVIQRYTTGSICHSSVIGSCVDRHYCIVPLHFQSCHGEWQIKPVAYLCIIF